MIFFTILVPSAKIIADENIVQVLKKEGNTS